jgi:hypothetical protein
MEPRCCGPAIIDHRFALRNALRMRLRDNSGQLFNKSGFSRKNRVGALRIAQRRFTFHFLPFTFYLLPS